MIQDGQVPIGLYGKTQHVRQRAKPSVKFLISITNCGAAIYIGWRTKLPCNEFQRHSFAHHFFAARTPRTPLLPPEVRRERSRIHIFELA